MNNPTLQALQYVQNTGGVTAAQFDEDNEPIGPQLRADIAPYISTNAETGKISLNEAGLNMLKEPE